MILQLTDKLGTALLILLRARYRSSMLRQPLTMNADQMHQVPCCLMLPAVLSDLQHLVSMTLLDHGQECQVLELGSTSSVRNNVEGCAPLISLLRGQSAGVGAFSAPPHYS